MLLEFLLAALLGIFAGIFTGLVPGVHINLVSVLVLSASGFFLQYTSPFVIAAFIIAMAITHTFLDNIPSIFLGAPDTGTVLGVLPGHRMLLQGQGYLAVKITTWGSLLGLILVTLLIPLIAPIVPIFFPFLQKFMGWILLSVVAFMVLHEKRKLLALVFFLLSGVLGLITLNSSVKTPLFPLLSGLFGISTLLLSLNEKVNIPPQEITEHTKMKKSVVVKASAASLFSGSCVSLFPGVGAGEAALLGNALTGGKLGDKGFLFLVGAINTINMAMALLTFYALGKPRNGAIVIVKEIIQAINFSQLLAFLGLALLVGGIATFLTLLITKKFSQFITKISYTKTCWAVIIFVSMLVLLLSGITGFFILVVATAIGLLPALTGVKRSINMGCLLLPVILWFLV